MVPGLLPFLGLTAVLVAIPGPSVTLTMKNAVIRGAGSALTTAAGVLVADLVWMFASVAGLTAVLVASEPAFLALKFLGAAYLAYLGIRLLVSRHDALDPPPSGGQRRPVSRWRAFREGVVCELSNPKTLLVFTSVIPQFLPHGHDVASAVILGVAFALSGFASLTLYAMAFAQAGRLNGRPAVRRAVLRASGAVLVAFGIRVATGPAN